MASVLSETSALAGLPAPLRAVIERLSGAITRSKKAKIVLLGAALVIVLKLLLGARSKRRRYVSDLDTVGQPTGARTTSTGPLVDAKYDVIIVGGGMKSQLAVSELDRHLRARSRRNRRMCARCTALRGPYHPCSSP